MFETLERVHKISGWGTRFEPARLARVVIDNGVFDPVVMSRLGSHRDGEQSNV